METHFPDFKHKNKWRTPATVAGSFGVAAMAVVFVAVFWNQMYNFGGQVQAQDGTLSPPRSDVSEQGVKPDISNEDSSDNPKTDDLGKDTLDENNVTDSNASDIESPWNPKTDPDYQEKNPNGDLENNGDSSNVAKPDIVLSQETLRFKPDSAEFADEAKAVEIIAKYADDLQDYILDVNPKTKVYVIGSVADTWDNVSEYSQNSQALSEKRALAVLDVLIKSGVPENSVFAFGMGNRDPWHILNLENGVFDENIAKENRKVVIVMSGDKAAGSINSRIIENGKTLTMFRYVNGELLREEFDRLY